MNVLFWLSLAAVVYAYAGYPALLALLARVHKQPVQTAAITPTISIIIAAHNEATTLSAKLANVHALHYPVDRIQVIVASDGSTDETNAILRSHSPRVTPVLIAHPKGKANALNHAVQRATGEILVFFDVRQSVDPDALRELVTSFADPRVGAVSGELHLETPEGLPSPDGLGIYWKIEKMTRRLESATGSVVGVTGAIYAMRRELFQPIPSGLLLDDVLIPMQVARAGLRVLFHPGAIARDHIFQDTGKEFSRKVRTLTGNYQLLRLAPWLLSAGNPLLFRLISHKLLRLAVPLLLLLLFVTSAIAAGPFYKLAFTAQILFYAMALLGYLAPATRAQKAVSVAYTFTMLNVAAAYAFYNFLGGRTRWA